MANKLQTQADHHLSGAVDRVAPWTIKAVATETRNLAIIAARKQGLTVGQFLERHMRHWMNDGESAEVSQGLPESAPIQALPAPPVSLGPTALEAAAQAAQIVKQLSDIPGLPESVHRLAFAVLRDRLKRARE